jgi:hypothetical protein
VSFEPNEVKFEANNRVYSTKTYFIWAKSTGFVARRANENSP